jgi:hypothetical protein
VVSLGYKENVTLPQIRTFIEMDSHEERIHDLVEKVIINIPNSTTMNANRTIIVFV